MRPELTVDIWWTESLRDSTVDLAEEAAGKLAAPLGTGVNVYRRGVYSGNDDHDTYDKYIQEFKNVEHQFTGVRSLLIYERAFENQDGGHSDDHPNLGFSRGGYRQDEKSYAIVNGNIRESALDTLGDFLGVGAGAIGDWFLEEQQDKIFENLVQHEILHAMLQDYRAPDYTTDHSFGEVRSHWTWVRDRTSPMLTGYTEPRFSGNAPDNFCQRDSNTATAWQTTISDCTEQEGVRWLTYEYDGNDDDGPPPCEPGEPC